jgi:hypothetical protein
MCLITRRTPAAIYLGSCEGHHCPVARNRRVRVRSARPGGRPSDSGALADYSLLIEVGEKFLIVY